MPNRKQPSPEIVSNEKWEKSPKGWPQTEPYVWNRRHDEYDL